MIWHVVTFDMSSIEDATRREIEGRLAKLAELDEVTWLEVSRDRETPTMTGLLSVFANEADLDAYRTHPEHVPVVEDIRARGIPVTRLDLDASLPSTPADR